MITWLRTDFDVDVTIEDIKACNAGNWWDDPIRRAIMRKFHLSYPVDVRVGWGYLNIFFEEETDLFDIVERKTSEEYLRNFADGKAVGPIHFNVRVNKIVPKKPVSTAKTPKRYSKEPPKTARLGL